MPLLLVLALLAFVEITLLVRAAEALGGMPTFALVLLTAVGGVAVARAQGAGLMQRLQRELGAGRVPDAEPVEALLLLFAGALLAVPGFLTDAAGVLLLLPPVRRQAARGLRARFARGPRGGVFVQLGGRGPGGLGGLGGLGGEHDEAGRDADGPAHGEPARRGPRYTADGTPIRDVHAVQRPPPGLADESSGDDAPASDTPPAPDERPRP